MKRNKILERYKKQLDYQISRYYNIDFIKFCQENGVATEDYLEMKGHLKGLKTAREMLEKIEAEEQEPERRNNDTRAEN